MPGECVLAIVGSGSTRLEIEGFAGLPVIGSARLIKPQPQWPRGEERCSSPPSISPGIRGSRDGVEPRVDFLRVRATRKPRWTRYRPSGSASLGTVGVARLIGRGGCGRRRTSDLPIGLDQPTGARRGTRLTALLAKAIRELVAEDLARHRAGLVADDRREFARQQVFVHLDELTSSDGGGWMPCVSTEEEQLLARTVLDALFGMGRLQALVDDPHIENIDINGCDRVWATFADGSKTVMSPVADSDAGVGGPGPIGGQQVRAVGDGGSTSPVRSWTSGCRTEAAVSGDGGAAEAGGLDPSAPILRPVALRPRRLGNPR